MRRKIRALTKELHRARGGRSAICELCPTRKVDHLVTSDAAPAQLAQRIGSLGVKIE